MDNNMHKSYGARAWLIWILAAAFFFSEYFARVAPSVMAPDLMRAFHVNALSLGTLSAFFYYSYVGMQLPVGTLVDKYGAHRLLTATAILCGAACFLFASAHHLAIADLARFLMGLAAAFAFVGTLKLARIWFPSNRFGLLVGATQALGMLGAAVGEGPVAAVVEQMGWRPTMILIGIILIVLGVLIGFVVRDTPPGIARAVYTDGESSLWRNLLEVLRCKQCWINCLYVGFLYAPSAAFAELWGASYIHGVYGVSATVAASAISAIFIGFAISSPIAGWLSDRMHSRKIVMLYSTLGSMIFMSAALYLPNLPVWGVFVLLFLYGMSNVGVATAYAVASELVPARLAGTSMGFANMASVMVGSYLFQPLIGWFLDLGWGHQMFHGAPMYSVHAYRVAMISLPICSLISLIAWCFLRESYPEEGAH